MIQRRPWVFALAILAAHYNATLFAQSRQGRTTWQEGEGGRATRQAEKSLVSAGLSHPGTLADGTWQGEQAAAFQVEDPPVEGSVEYLFDIPSQQQAMADNVIMSFDATPLIEVVDEIRFQYQLPIFLDLDLLMEAGVESDHPVTLEFRGTLADGLQAVLDACVPGLCITRFNDVFMVTSAESDIALQMRVYAIARGADAEEIQEHVESNIAPQTWDFAGGQGTIAYFPGRMVIVNTIEVHKQIVARYPQHLRILNLPPRNDGQAVNGRPATPEDALNRVLPNSAVFRETPLGEVFALLTQHCQLPVVVNRGAFIEMGIDLNATTVTGDYRGIPIRSAISIMLRQLHLTYRITDDQIQVTTIEEADALMYEVSYPVNQLPNAARGDADLLYELFSIIDARSWEDAGGPGRLRVVRGNTIEVFQTYATHQKIAHFIACLRMTP